MKGIFCEGCKARNNEEFRLVLKKRQRRLLALLVVGVLTVALCFIVPLCLGFRMEEILAGDIGTAGSSGSNIWFTIGIGAGLAVGALIAFFKLRYILSHEDKLKEKRLTETDERLQEIHNRSLQGTAKIILILLYFFMILGFFMDHEVMESCRFLLVVFFFSYIVLHRSYENKI